jgi:triosephosphate isomerase
MNKSKPLIFINFKTYKQGSGKRALEIAKYCQKVNGKAQLAIAVQPTELYRIARSVAIPVFAQHIDLIEYGSHTGWILPEDVKEAGAQGTLINHSEHRLPKNIIKALVKKAKDLRLITIVCAKNVGEGAALARFKPDYIAVEPPELIGNPKLSVCRAKPGLIKNAVDKIKAPVLVGAGVKCAEDVRVALKLGAKGVLLASDVMKSKKPLNALRELVRGV